MAISFTTSITVEADEAEAFQKIAYDLLGGKSITQFHGDFAVVIAYPQNAVDEAKVKEAWNILRGKLEI